jgi:hypothetical protein
MFAGLVSGVLMMMTPMYTRQALQQALQGGLRQVFEFSGALEAKGNSDEL